MLSATEWRLSFLDLIAFMHGRPHGDWRTRCMIVHGDRLDIVGILPPRRQRKIDVRIYANNNRVACAHRRHRP